MGDSKAIAPPKRPPQHGCSSQKLKSPESRREISQLDLPGNCRYSYNFAEGPSGFRNFPDLPEPCPFLLFPGPCLFLLLPESYDPPTFPQEGTFQLGGESRTVVRSEQKTSSWQVRPSLLSRSYVSSRANLSIVS